MPKNTSSKVEIRWIYIAFSALVEGKQQQKVRGIDRNWETKKHTLE